MSGAEIVNDYTYDSYGNLTQTKTRQNGQEYVKSYAYGTAWSDVLTSFDGKNITYDTLGKPKKYYNGLELTWATGKLSEVNSDGVQACYRYGYDGLREEKIVNGLSIEFIYEGHDLIAELSDDSIYYTYDGNFNLVGFEWNGKRYYYQYSIFGDVIGILNENGKTLCSYSYDIWGALLSVTGDSALATRNPIRYRGYYYDNETGLYYLESRYYDPNTKRFISYDDLESFFYGEEESIESLFVYCGNNPVIYCDESGRDYYSNSVLATSEFWNETSGIIQEVNSFVRSKPNTTSGTGRFRFNTSSEFVYAWNSMGYTQFVVVIDCHGEPQKLLGSGTTVIATISTIKNSLSFKNITAIILLGCNCGHYDWRNSNIARTFADRFGAAVFAADGTVDAGTNKPNDDAEWRKWNTSNRSLNYGWLVYTARNSSNHYQGGITILGRGKMSVRQMLANYYRSWGK